MGSAPTDDNAPPDRRTAATAADGSAIAAGDTVLVVAEVLGAAGPTHDLPDRDTGVVALKIESYDGGHAYSTPHHKVCVPPKAVARVVKRN